MSEQEHYALTEHILSSRSDISRLINKMEELESDKDYFQTKLDEALDKIFEIQEKVVPPTGVCNVCGICNSMPLEYQPLDDENCRTILEDWAYGRPLPWQQKEGESMEDSE